MKFIDNFFEGFVAGIGFFAALMFIAFIGEIIK